MSIHPSAGEVRSYYNDFLQKRMLAYRLYGNDRIDLAARFFLENIAEDSTIVDIGCGIGIATEIMAKKASRGRVIGLDISDRNIWYATKTVSIPNTTFHCIDIIKNASRIREISGSPVDIFTLCDVMEHIPDTDRTTLLQSLAEIGSPNVKILVTIPSEFYQGWLSIDNREELQIVDNTITAQMLDGEARAAGFVLTYFRLVDVWHKVQYAHCTLQRAESLDRFVRQEVTNAKPNPVLNLFTRAVNKVQQKTRQRKYIDDVFGKL